MANGAHVLGRLEAKRREQTPQALARLVVVTLFAGLWLVLWLLRIPMPLPFLIALLIEIVFFLGYWRLVFVLPNQRAITWAHYGMLATEIVLHTTMVYFLGGVAWLGSFAYVFGLVFTTAFLDLRRSLLYTAGQTLAFGALILLEATGVVPHYAYLEQGPLRYTDPRFVATTLIGAVGVFFSMCLWSSWVGHQLRRERDAAIRAQDDLLRARAELQRANEALESRVHQRTAELERTNAALRESEERLRTVISNAPVVVFSLDSEGVFTLAEGKGLATLDADADRIVGVSALQAFEGQPEVVRRIRGALAGEAATTLARSGDVLFEAHLEPLRSEDGQPVGVIGVAVNVTERQRAEDALRESEAKFRAMAETVAASTFIYQGTKIRYVNSTAESFTGYSRDELLAMDFWEVIHPEFRDLVRQRGLARQESANVPARYEVKIVTKDGHERWVDFTAGVIEYEGEPAVLGTAFDITERKRTESILAGQRAILEMIAVGAPLPKVLDEVVLMSERELAGGLCSICLVSADGAALVPAAAPSLPVAFREAMAGGVAIGPDAASCGAAAYRRQPVVSVDIAGDPVWDDFRALALENGLRSCWSTPIFASNGQLLGTFAIYHREPHEPDGSERLLVAVATHIAGIAIERTLAEAALRESEETLKTTLESTADGILVVELDGAVVYANKRFGEMWRIPGALLAEPNRDRLIAYVMDELSDPEAFVRSIGELRRSAGERLDTLTFKDGRIFERYALPFHKDGSVAGHVISFRDITERKRAEEALRKSEETLKATIESTADGILVVGNAGQVVYANARFAEMWRIPKALIATKDDHALLAYAVNQVRDPEAFLAKVQDLYQSEREDIDTIHFTDGRVFERYSRPLMLDGRVEGRVWSFRDVTERRRAEEALHQQARRDSLTGLLNRRAGLAAIEERLAVGARERGRLAVFILDIDRFKLLNDSYSHETGDAALRHLGQVMSALVGDRGVVCRLGGDEFEIALDGTDLDGAVRFAEGLRTALRRSLLDAQAEGLPLFTGSIGIACYPEDGTTVLDLTRHADRAMYAAKAAGPGSIRAWRRLAPRAA
jgi:diguanylate cyclase (GGDEF)-like protein/PAS domain S-box-containing protein